MDIQNHIGFLESYLGIGVGCKLVKQVFDIVSSRLGGFLMIACDGGKGHESCRFDFADVVQDSSEFLLYCILLIISSLGGRVL